MHHSSIQSGFWLWAFAGLLANVINLNTAWLCCDHAFFELIQLTKKNHICLVLLGCPGKYTDFV